MKSIEAIDSELLNKVSEQAKSSPRLRMNYIFHQSLDDKCHRMLNALEPGTDIPTPTTSPACCLSVRKDRI